MVLADLPPQGARVDVDLPRRRQENRYGQEHRVPGATKQRLAQAHEADAGERRERRRHRGEIVEVKEASRIAVDDAICGEPADPQEHREARRRRPAASAIPPRAERQPGQRERQEPADLPGELAVGEPQRSGRRLHE